MRPGLMLCSLTVVGALAASAAAATQTGMASRATARKATTVPALIAYPLFFHTQAVRIRGFVEPRGDRRFVLRQGEASEVAVAGPGLANAPATYDVLVEITGVFLDVGRLAEGDPRLRGVDLGTVWSGAGRSWPAVGELLLLVADTLVDAEPFPAPSVRALALDPWRYVEQRVTVTGRFRGFNLYGDLPEAPSRSRWAFVLQLAEAGIWVVGKRPRGDGFDLDINARVDTGRWLEVAGTVTLVRGLAVIEAQTIALGKEPAGMASASEPAARVPAVGPRPEVVFSLPTKDEIDVAPTTSVRIQFSRDIDPRSFAGQVRVGYLAAQAVERGEAQPPAVEYTTSYDEGLRVLEIRFAAPLERFRTVRVRLLEGIRATDGAALEPWTLTFSLGG